jgi:hypothetical protein
MHRLAYNEMIQKQSDISARLADINQHFAERIKVEILETLDTVQKINARNASPRQDPDYSGSPDLCLGELSMASNIIRGK